MILFFTRLLLFNNFLELDIFHDLDNFLVFGSKNFSINLLPSLIPTTSLITSTLDNIFISIINISNTAIILKL